jgi:phosphatidylserine/phosphatidylglycerophosphate/cardiolipin synthase-like enzyme
VITSLPQAEVCGQMRQGEYASQTTPLVWAVNAIFPIRSTFGSIAHKIMIIDRQTVLTGSFNFTTAAEEHNPENLLVINDEACSSVLGNSEMG